MKLKTVPARQGVLWVRAGFRVFFRQPFGFSALFALFGLAVLVLLQLPFVGPVLALALMPFATVVFMLATREVLAGRRLRPKLMLLPLTDPLLRRRLFALGSCYALAVLAVALVAHLADGGRLAALAEAMADGQQPDAAALNDGALQFGVLLRVGLMALLTFVFWHAPGLVTWGGMSTAKALFASVVACWRSAGAFALYGLMWVAAMLVLTTVVELLLMPFGGAEAATQAVLPMTMLFSAVYYASIYFTFVDSFEMDPPAAAAL